MTSPNLHNGIAGLVFDINMTSLSLHYVLTGLNLYNDMVGLDLHNDVLPNK